MRYPPNSNFAVLAAAMAMMPKPCTGPHDFSEPVGRLRMKICNKCGAMEREPEPEPEIDFG